MSPVSQGRRGRFTHIFSSPQTFYLLGIAAFTILLLANAWLHEDAFITLRTVDNFINGHGLRYNIVERVQTYTHPLWLFALVLPYAITDEPLFSTIFLSAFISILTLYLLLRFLAPTSSTRAVALVILISSRPYIDYGTSGLENPLSHMLLIVFYAVYFTRTASIRSLFFLTILASLAGVNRLDSLLFYIPPLAIYFLRFSNRKALTAIFLGTIPLIAWTLFSMVYYGFPIPNSAYAKLNTHVASWDLFIQGAYYYKDLLLRDPLTLSTIVVGLITTFWEKNRFKMAVAAGLVLYLLYILRIGGDYMSGRFFTIPLLSATVLLIRANWLNSLPRRGSLLFVGMILVIGFFSADPVLLPFESDRNPKEERGITNERLFYESHTGLLAKLLDDVNVEEHWLSSSGIRAREAGQSALITGGIGLAGYFAGPQVHVVDTLALADVFLARLPVGNPKYWRIGHFKRVRPVGFDESIRTGNNEIADPELAAFYDLLQKITRDPLFDVQRMAAIWKANFGPYSGYPNADDYIRQSMLPLERDVLCDQYATLLITGDQCKRNVPIQGFSVNLHEMQQARTIEIALDTNYDYEFIFLDGETEIGRLSDETPGPTGSDELATRKITIPPNITLHGFDILEIRPMFIGLDPKNPRVVGQIGLTE